MEREDEEIYDLGDDDLPLSISAASLEEIPATEYDSAIASLKSFLETSHDNVANYENLAEATSYVGPSLKTVILANARYWTEKDGMENIDSGLLVVTRKGHYIREWVNGHVLFACAGENFASLLTHRNRKKGINTMYSINFSLPESEDDQYRPAAIVDNYSKKCRYYEPSWFRKKKDYEEYFRIMKEVVADLISILPEPTRIPPAFNY